MLFSLSFFRPICSQLQLGNSIDPATPTLLKLLALLFPNEDQESKKEINLPQIALSRAQRKGLIEKGNNCLDLLTIKTVFASHLHIPAYSNFSISHQPSFAHTRVVFLIPTLTSYTLLQPCIMKAIYLPVISSTFLAILALSLPKTVLSAIPDQASFLPETMKEAPLFTPSPYDIPRHVSNNQLLFISQDSASIFYSLDLTVAWPATKPAWRKLPSPPSTGWWDLPFGGMSLSKDGSTVHFVSHNNFQSYYDNTAQWGPTINLTTSLDSGYGEYVVTDVDMGLVYSLGSMWEQNGDYVRSFSTFDPVSHTVAKVNPAPRAGVLFTQGVYSSTRKSLFYLSQGDTFTLYEYSITSDTWTYVVRGRNTLHCCYPYALLERSSNILLRLCELYKIGYQKQ